MNQTAEIINKIENNNFTIGIIGLGYVGLPLAVAFAEKGIKVTGFDNSAEKVTKINRAENYIPDVDDSVLLKVVDNGTFQANTDFTQLKNCEVIIICVPTPLDQFKKPDTSYIETACFEIGRNMKPGTFVCLESTTYPTTTENLMLPIIEKESGLKQGEDFYLAFSPERVDPGNKRYNTQNTPKILGALTPDGVKIGEAIYKKAIESIFTVSSPRVAEMVKILENTYRLVNISLINELALLCGKMNIDIWEVIEAAKTKPFGFQAFYPGPGIGGHCIPLDPFYLEHIAKKYNFDLSMIHTAGHIDMMMPHRMTIKITSALNRQKKAMNGSKILFLGVAYKPNIDDARESPAIKIIDEVINKGGEVTYHDPFIHGIITTGGHSLQSVQLTEHQLQQADCVVITTNHSAFNPEFIEKHSKLVVDLKNLIKQPSEKVYKL
jgi:UDP-N-acetyl-D-glucosamine dehydrogenase